MISVMITSLVIIRRTPCRTANGTLYRARSSPHRRTCKGTLSPEAGGSFAPKSLQISGTDWRACGCLLVPGHKTHGKRGGRAEDGFSKATSKQDIPALLCVAYLMMKFEHCVPNLGKQVPVSLQKQ